MIFALWFDVDQALVGDQTVMKRTYAALAALACLLFASVGFADQPKPWQMGMQEPATSIMEFNSWFEQYTLWFIVPITIFVLILLILVVVKFRAAANPVPSKTSHNTAIEIVWTVAPVLILFAIAIPSFNLLTYQLKMPENPDITIKATATQWLWSYEYEGEQAVSFDSYMLKETDRAAIGIAIGPIGPLVPGGGCVARQFRRFSGSHALLCRHRQHGARARRAPHIRQQRFRGLP